MVRSILFVALAATVLAPTVALAQGNGSGGSGTKPQYYRSASAAAAGLPFSDAVRVGRLLYVNNQVGNEPGAARLVSGGFAAELGQTMKNISVIVKAAGLDMGDVFKCTITLADMSNIQALNKLWPSYFPDGHLPVRNVIGVTGVPLGGAVGVECVADGR